MTPLELALKYAQCGLRVVPCHTPTSAGCSCAKGPACQSPGKHPRLSAWQKESSVDTRVLSEWFRRWPETNIGIATGTVSEIMVLDVDPRHGGLDSLKRLEKQNGGLPPTPTVSTGGRGFHHYLKHPGRAVKNKIGLLSGLDIRGDAGFVVAPPSLHVSGALYAWRPGRAPWEVQPAPCPEWLTCRIEAETSKTSETSETSKAICSCEDYATVEAAIRETLPECEGQRNRGIFRFAQRIRGIAEFADLPVNKLKPVVQQWHKRALPFIDTKAFDETWSDFRYAWPRIQHPGGFDLAKLVHRLEAEPVHPAAAAAGYETRERRLLVALCAELQKNSGDRTFYLSSHAAAKLVGTSPRQAYRILHGDFIEDSILELVEKGIAGGRIASRFRFTWRAPE
ncbi:MAG: bifunctional DNA primase/polymerase [Planctomycetes bacterium]|nr:bifunctional DNA primase/polymerase [Planctomycetota bacterium]